VSETAFSVNDDDGVTHLQFTRPASANSMTMEFWRGFPAAVQDLDQTGKIRALVISAQGKHFCSGMDLAVFQSPELQAGNKSLDREAFTHAILFLQRSLSVLEDVRFPVIAAVQGACLGAGLDLVAACDLRYAHPEAYFRVEEINIGMMADVGSLQRLPYKLPDAILREMAYTGATLSAGRAHDCGFVNELSEDPAARALAIAREIAQRAPLAVAGSKRAINFSRGHTIAEALEHAALLQGSLWETDDIRTAMEARKAKTAGKFANLKPRR
jgi:enoyl-CoA hydratase